MLSSPSHRYLLGRVVVLTVIMGLAPATGFAADPVTKFHPIFNGKDLKGWTSVPANHQSDWSVHDGAIRGTGSKNRLVYLVWKDRQLGNFELKLKYRMVTDGNSGVEIRAKVDQTGKRPFEGYHADFGHVGIGPTVVCV